MKFVAQIEWLAEIFWAVEETYCTPTVCLDGHIVADIVALTIGFLANVLHVI